MYDREQESDEPDSGPVVARLELIRSNNGYAYLTDGGRWVGHHQLLACVHTDPHTVFSKNIDVHHHFGQLDTCSNLEALTRSEHIRRHNGDSNRITLEQILSNPADDRTGER